MGLTRAVGRSAQRSGGRGRQRGPTEIVLRIESLVLEGFPAHHRWRIAATIEAELTRLVAEGGLPLGLIGAGSVGEIQAGGFAPGPADRPEAIGTQVAGAVYAGLGQGAGSARPERPGP
ncbi:MAG TPA: hypothetical protein VFH48_27485 [Chloroflexota bacterium]|nr:hypothetical protein [Chloroflexota bacterium]